MGLVGGEKATLAICIVPVTIDRRLACSSRKAVWPPLAIWPLARLAMSASFCCSWLMPAVALAIAPGRSP